MDPLTHVTTGLICSQLVTSPSRGWAALAGALFALFPDIDYFFIFWDRLAFIRYHRGFTHSLVALPLFALAGALLGRALGGPRWFKPLCIIGLMVLGSHLLLDLVTSYGTQLLSPLSRRRFALDWVFIIDPYLTTLLVVGAILVLAFPVYGFRLGSWCLAAVAVYVLVCSLYHHKAMDLATQAFQIPGSPKPSIAALPQPFSCRRWQLITASPGKVQQAFVQLPFAAASVAVSGKPEEMVSVPQSQTFVAPAVFYPPPGHLVVQTWTPDPKLPVLPPEAETILARYLEFARFPILCRVQSLQGEQLMEWLDLRFSVPGREFPFVLQLRLDARGRLQRWLIGRQGGENQ
jgi:inner membrane protein